MVLFQYPFYLFVIMKHYGSGVWGLPQITVLFFLSKILNFLNWLRLLPFGRNSFMTTCYLQFMPWQYLCPACSLVRNFVYKRKCKIDAHKFEINYKAQHKNASYDQSRHWAANSGTPPLNLVSLASSYSPEFSINGNL